MNRSVLFHRENEWEWLYVGIWADMLDKSILEINEEDVKDFLILFKEYDTPLQILQENLRLRNLYNQFKSNNSFAEIQKMEDDIKRQISELSDKLDIFAYYAKEDLLMKVSFDDYQLYFLVL
jgi:hypothetical protein